MIAAYTVASKGTCVRRCRSKRVLTPGLSDLFEALSVISATAHPVKILRNKWMVIAWQGNPSNVLGPFVTSISAQRDADTAVDGTIVQLYQVNQVAYDDIGAGNSPDCRHHSRLRLPVNELVDLDRLHRRAD